MALILTVYKEKVPKGFKYPVGAELISQALSGVPQFGLLRLHFSWKSCFWASEYRARVNSAGAIEIMEMNNFNGKWIVSVHAVPSAEGQSARECLEHSLQTLKTRLMGTKTEPKYFCWKAIYGLATHTLHVG
jgi:hypothetical protein